MRGERRGDYRGSGIKEGGLLERIVRDGWLLETTAEG